MAVLMKWNYDKHDYDEYFVPDGVKCKTFSCDMDEIVYCAQCFREIRFGDGYTSMEIHNLVGFGYCVCTDCYEAERERWIRNREVQDEENV